LFDLTNQVMNLVTWYGALITNYCCPSEHALAIAPFSFTMNLDARDG